MNIRSSQFRLLAASILSVAALGLSAGAYAQHHGDSHSSGGGGGSGGGHSSSHGGGGGGVRPSGGHGGYGGYGGGSPRGSVGYYRGSPTVQRSYAPSNPAPSGRGWTGGAAGRGWSGGSASHGWNGGGYGHGSSGYVAGRGSVDHRVYNPVHGRGGWNGHPGGGWGGGYYGGYYGSWGYRPYWSFVSVLPWYYSTMWWNGIPYYYADNSYYVWDDSAAQYQVVPPPGNAEAQAAEAPAAGDLYVYPNAGQSDEQQSTDRYECHRWAADQTGFDPTRANGGVAPEAAGQAADDYRRAEGACLQGRGYTVR